MSDPPSDISLGDVGTLSTMVTVSIEFCNRSMSFALLSKMNKLLKGADGLGTSKLGVLFSLRILLVLVED